MSDTESQAAEKPTPPDVAPPEDCPRCGKPPDLCVCAEIQPIANTVALLILQHPQEQDKSLGTARLTALHLGRSVFKVGLSWPSLAKALGRPADPKKWATLYLGSVDPHMIAPGQEVLALDAKGNLLPRQEEALADIEGVIVLDGTWSQAKTLWWRNPWLLKSRRIVLGPARPSLYGALRREPRREALSTLESAGMLISRLEGRPEIEDALRATFQRLLERYRKAPKPATNPGRRGRSSHRRPPGKRQSA